MMYDIDYSTALLKIAKILLFKKFVNGFYKNVTNFVEKLKVLFVLIKICLEKTSLIKQLL